MRSIAFILLFAFQTSNAQFFLNDSVWFDTTYIPGAAYGADIGQWDPKTHPFFIEMRQDWQRLSGFKEGDTTPWGIQHYDRPYKIDSMEEKIITWGNQDVEFIGDWTRSEECLCAWNNNPSDSNSIIEYSFYGFNVRMYGQSLPHLGQFVFELDGRPYTINQSTGQDSTAMNIGFPELDTAYHKIKMYPIGGHMVFKWLLINYRGTSPEPGKNIPVWVWYIIAGVGIAIVLYFWIKK